MIRRSALFVLSLCLSQTAAVAQAAPQDWGARCDATTCTLSRGILEEASGKRLSTLLVVLRKGEDKVLFGAALPIGVALEPGIRILQGDTMVEAKFQVCYPDGCRALVELPLAAVTSMAKAGSAEFRAFPYESEKPISFMAPLSGLDMALQNALDTLAKAP
jgi:invasion protein IalB